MPTYMFLDSNTYEEVEIFMGISEMEKYLLENVHMKPLINGSPMITSGVAKKPDDSFRDILRNIKKANSRGITQSSINTY